MYSLGKERKKHKNNSVKYQTEHGISTFNFKALIDHNYVRNVIKYEPNISKIACFLFIFFKNKIKQRLVYFIGHEILHSHLMFNQFNNPANSHNLTEMSELDR